ncbi:hypothetical protein [Limosilactobacillus reuteri]|uniref:hypothetical protein n=1 Tax=Limosilactobacillus reuteri TaxID=1598 RepID=UPI0034D39AB0
MLLVDLLVLEDVLSQATITIIVNESIKISAIFLIKILPTDLIFKVLLYLNL